MGRDTAAAKIQCMTPVPKNLSPKQVLVWRRLIRTGMRPVKAASAAKGGWGYRKP